MAYHHHVCHVMFAMFAKVVCICDGMSFAFTFILCPALKCQCLFIVIVIVTHIHACTHTHMHWKDSLKEKTQRKGVLFCELSFFLSWGQAHNDPAKMDREIVLWSDPRTQIGRRSVWLCVYPCVFHTTNDLTAPLVLLDWWVLRGHVGPRASISGKKQDSGSVRIWNGGRMVKNTCILYQTYTAWA